VKRDSAALPELTEENEDEKTSSTVHEPEQNVRFKVTYLFEMLCSSVLLRIISYLSEQT
jgi:hypothetical protein